MTTNLVAFLFLAAGCLQVAICLPLIYRKIPMNYFYGIRFPSSFRSDQYWYDINEYGGRILARWSLVIVLAGIAGFFFPSDRLNEYVAVAVAVSLGSVLVALIQTFLWVRRYVKV